ncbi:non-structural maintenance of chromosomes element 1 homolog [Ylistrum balloti]|uniref:non-structural maintenance of chromosomes element 1 homolog n=1 Tax=Ylistrum balloti TaxID=509963 RepID=UPI002905BCE9|nr:non-structural maintenance of chromosomes element 1 homolog [Ylistrum balloti]XP_060085663.1 non-structural maintenance of chromosomes element 1 homolog [Ylistrum balloti]
MSMRDSHRLFLQSFMSRGLLDAKEVRLLFRTVCLKFNEPTAAKEEDRKLQLLDFVRTINMKIRPFHMEIKKGVSEDEGVSYYCLVCTNESAITKLASDYTQSELEFFKKLVDQIVDNEGEIGSTAAVNIVDKLDKNMKKMTRQDAQSLLQRLESAKWIIIHKGTGIVSLSTRCLLELEQYILDVYGAEDENLKCNMCNKLCVKGQSCDNCQTKLHLHCASRFFQNKDNPRCPNKTCGTSWPHPVPKKGPSADTQSSQVPSTSTCTDAFSGRKRKLRS